jgi:hypothetical protein
MLGGAPARTCCTAERLGECVPQSLATSTWSNKVTHRKHANQLEAGKVLGCGKGSASRAVDAKELHLLRSLAHHIDGRLLVYLFICSNDLAPLNTAVLPPNDTSGSV